MKRNLEINESSGLLKNQSPEHPILVILHFFEVIVVSTSVFYVPNLPDDCGDAPLALWATLMIPLCGLHLLVTAINNLVYQILAKQVMSNSAVKIAHAIAISVIVIWVGLGHFWAFGKAFDCNGTHAFLACVLLLVVFDALFIAFALSLFVDIWNKRFNEF